MITHRKSEGHFIKQMDGLRFLAVTGVLILHFVYIKNEYLKRIPCGYGVNLFFVISGYFITKILIQNKIAVQTGISTTKKALTTFYLRRVLRIFPIYYITICFLYLINFQNTREVFAWLVSYSVNIYLCLDKPYIGSFNHLWSLGVEEQFYLLWPFLIFIISEKNIKYLIYGSILSAVAFKIIYFIFWGSGGALNAFTLSCADALGLGALIAFWSIYKVETLNKINRNRFVIPCTFLLFALVTIYPGSSKEIVSVFANSLFAVFAFTVVAKASQGKFSGIIKRVLENKIILHLGKISYGIYLYHYFMPDFYNFVAGIFPQTGFESVKTLFYFASALIFAELSWIIIERPLLHLKHYFKY
jgi:peptidoglycan/LPS O-acetylase OafA/YrhL